MPFSCSGNHIFAFNMRSFVFIQMCPCWQMQTYVTRGHDVVCLFQMCMYMYVYVYVRVQANIEVYTRAFWLSTDLVFLLLTWLRWYTYIYVYVYICMYICMYVCMHVCIYMIICIIYQFFVENTYVKGDKTHTHTHTHKHNKLVLCISTSVNSGFYLSPSFSPCLSLSLSLSKINLVHGSA